MSRRSPPVVLVLAMLVAAMELATAACGGLPTDGPVQQGLPAGARPVQPVHILPDGPIRDGSPEQIVRGFLSAGSGYDKDHAVARSFFSAGSGQAWEPSAGVWVFAGESSLRVAMPGPQTVRVSADIVARIDPDGRYRDERAGTRTQAVFEMEQNPDRQWRIARSPPGFGLWLSANDLDRLYSPFEIAYVSPVSSTVISDRRWFAVTPGVATTLARAQLAPVPSYLQGAVTTGIPAGTRLAVDAVPVVSGRALVDLSDMALSAPAQLRSAIWAQFVQTLLQAPAVQQVSVTVEGSRLDAAGKPATVSTVGDVGYGLDRAAIVSVAVIREGDALRRQDPGRMVDESPRRAATPAGPPLPRIPTGWTSLTLSPDGQEIAAIGGDRAEVARWQGNRFVPVPTFATALTRPSYDRLGSLWVAGVSGPASGVWVIDTSAKDPAQVRPQRVEARWLGSRRVLSLRMSRDNQRAAIVTSNARGGDIQVGVSGVVRGTDRRPRSLTEPLPVAGSLIAATEASWMDENTLAIVGRVSTSESMRPYTVGVGGRLIPLAPVAGAKSITATGGSQRLVVLTDRGTMFSRDGSGWHAIGKGTDFLMPGG